MDRIRVITQDNYIFQEPKENRRIKLSKDKISRNDLCPCGSGLKFKKCCRLKNEKGINITAGS